MGNGDILQAGVGRPPDSEAERLSGLMLEQRAQLADRRINDQLLKELIRQFVVSERRLKELGDLKDKFLGMAAHDLRNPLTAIIGMSKMLLTMKLDEAKQQRFLEGIHRAGNQMLELVNDLLDVSVIESGKFSLNREAGNLARMTGNRVELMALIAAEKDIELLAEFEAVPDGSFDAERLSQVVDNLLSNAIKFSPRGATVRLSVRSAGRMVEIAVADRGPGIPADEIDRLFGAFEKLSVRPTGGEKSTGLGLAIVKKIVEAHDGEISVESEVGKGTTFTVSLPN